MKRINKDNFFRVRPPEPMTDCTSVQSSDSTPLSIAEQANDTTSSSSVTTSLQSRHDTYHGIEGLRLHSCSDDEETDVVSVKTVYYQPPNSSTSGLCSNSNYIVRGISPNSSSISSDAVDTSLKAADTSSEGNADHTQLHISDIAYTTGKSDLCAVSQPGISSPSFFSTTSSPNNHDDSSCSHDSVIESISNTDDEDAVAFVEYNNNFLKYFQGANGAPGRPGIRGPRGPPGPIGPKGASGSSIFESVTDASLISTGFFEIFHKSFTITKLASDTSQPSPVNIEFINSISGNTTVSEYLSVTASHHLRIEKSGIYSIVIRLFFALLSSYIIFETDNRTNLEANIFILTVQKNSQVVYHQEFEAGGENPLSTLNIPFITYLQQNTELSLSVTSKDNSAFELALLGNPHPSTPDVYDASMLSKTEILFIG